MNFAGNQKSGHLLRVVLSIVCCIAISDSLMAYYYGDPQCFGYESVTGYQTQPDVQFDQNGRLHMVWSEYRSGFYNIYHRIRTRFGVMGLPGRADMEGTCDSFNCALSYPQIQFNSSDEAVMVCYGVYPTTPYLPASIYRPSPFPARWYQIAGAHGPSGGLTSKISLASYGTHIFIAYEINGTIELNRYTDIGWETAYSMPISAGQTYLNPDIAMDEEGYLYLAFDEIDINYTTAPRRIIVCRSYNSDDISYGFMPLRPIDTRYDSTWLGDPAITVSGKFVDGTLAVAVSYIGINATEPFVYCKCEPMGEWTLPSTIGGYRSQACSWSSGIDKSPANPDIAFGTNNEIHVAWQDTRSGIYEIFAAVSFNRAQYFLQDQMISLDNFTSGGDATYPSICTYEPTNDVVISYERKDGLSQRILASGAISDFYDQCRTPGFLLWSSSSGVILDATFGYDPPCYRLRNAATRGQLIKDYGLGQVTGSIELEFYDSLSTTADFSVRIDGDDGLKAGVYRMLGINNATTPGNYSINAGSGIWVDTGISRGAAPDWHHILMTVDDSGIEMFLDPEVNAAPVHESSSFVWFNQVTIQGGDALDPYFIDDIRIVEDISYTVPAMSVAGIVMTLLGLAVLLRQRRSN